MPENNMIKITNIHCPQPVMAILCKVAEITGANSLCIGGGFLRGLYMQQRMSLNPKMNDIDIFADLSIERFDAVRNNLEAAFGNPVRFHIGQFEAEHNRRGLIEFSLPPSWKAGCAGAETIQLNFGKEHPWAALFYYINQANVSMNQIAVGLSGDVMASPAFGDDLEQRTMTMNPNRHWLIHDWQRTVRSLERMVVERPEFQGWKIIRVPKPDMLEGGYFWHSDTTNPVPSVP